MATFSEEDFKFMRRAMELAEKGAGFVNPNPLVGAVIVKDGRVIGEGWHERYGQLHAERNAFLHCTENPEGATMYVTLEPCCHFGKTPPCTDAVMEHGIKRVVVGMKDPNPLVGGKGLAILEKAGIEVRCGIMEKELREQNRVFLKYIGGKMPWIALKTAMSLDGKIAAASGDSKWISCEESRRYAHGLRARFMAVMCGVGTVLADDPMLNCRIADREVRQPVRVIADSHLRTPLDSKVLGTAVEYRTVMACTGDADTARRRAFESAGVEIIECSSDAGGKVAMDELLKRLGAMGIDSVLVEGGGTVAYSLVRQGLADEVYSFIAPKIIGGASALTPVEGEGVEKVVDAFPFEIKEAVRIGNDIMLRSECLRA